MQLLHDSLFQPRSVDGFTLLERPKGARAWIVPIVRLFTQAMPNLDARKPRS